MWMEELGGQTKKRPTPSTTQRDVNRRWLERATGCVSGAFCTTDKGNCLIGQREREALNSVPCALERELWQIVPSLNPSALIIGIVLLARRQPGYQTRVGASKRMVYIFLLLIVNKAHRKYVGGGTCEHVGGKWVREGEMGADTVAAGRSYSSSELEFRLAAICRCKDCAGLMTAAILIQPLMTDGNDQSQPRRPASQILWLV
ncbi:hypothetical protein V8F06_007180 [Rhypophila decipiens]